MFAVSIPVNMSGCEDVPVESICNKYARPNASVRFYSDTNCVTYDLFKRH